MKNVSEVCKIVGVTRRTLQEYDRIGLLSPTVKNDSGRKDWLYDDNSIQTLMLIQVYVEAGYKRDQIKDLIYSNTLTSIESIQKLSSVLREKQMHFNGLASSFDIWTKACSIPKSSQKALLDINVLGLYDSISFKNILSENISLGENLSTDEKEATMQFTKLWFAVCAIGCLKKHPPSSPIVQICVRNFCRILSEVIRSESQSSVSNLPEVAQVYIAATVCADGFDELFKDKEARQLIEKPCGEGSVEFIHAALIQYCVDNKTIEEKYGLEEYT